MKVNNLSAMLGIFSLGILIGFTLHEIYFTSPNIAPINNNVNQPNYSDGASIASTSERRNANGEGLFAADENKNYEATTVEQSLDNQLINIQDLGERLDQAIENSASTTFIHKLMDDWLKYDLEAARNWLFSKPHTAPYDGLFFLVIPAIAAKDYEQAGDLIQSIENLTLASNLATDYVKNYVAFDPNAAANFVEGLQDPSLKVSATATLLESWSDTMPQTFLTFLFNQTLVDPQEFSDLIVDSSISLAQIDTDNAVFQLETYPPEHQKNIAYGMAIGMGKENAVIAHEWVNAILNEGVRDKALSGLLDSNNYQNEEAAIQLAAKISQSYIRDSHLNTIFKNWFASDPEGATKALNETDVLNEYQRQNLLNLFSLNE